MLFKIQYKFQMNKKQVKKREHRKLVKKHKLYVTRKLY